MFGNLMYSGLAALSVVLLPLVTAMAQDQKVREGNGTIQSRTQNAEKHANARADETQNPKAIPGDGVSTSPESYREALVLYSQAYLDLAKYDLESAQKISSSLSISALERRRLAVKVAEERLRVAMLPPGEIDTTSIRMHYAEEYAKSARRSYLQAAASQTFTDAQLERLRLKSVLAARAATVMSNPVHVMSLLDHMHWELDRLKEDVAALQLRIEELEKQ